MNKQQLKHLEEEIRAGTTIHDEYSPTLAPFPSAPYEYVIEWLPVGPQGAMRFFLDLTLWSDYYRYHVTREQPEEEGWATQESTVRWSPYLSEILTQLEDRGIPLPSVPSTWSNPCPGVYVRGTWTGVIGTPLPSPAQQISASAIARGLGGAGA